MKKILALCGGVLLLVGCDKQRDLYDTSNTLLHIEGSWTRSLNQENMLDATVLLYKDGEIKKEFLSRPNGVTTRVTRGRYDVVTFNGVMESENVTNLDHVHFRGTDRLESFEAYAEEGRPNSRLSRAEGEYIASNEMELLTFVHTGVDVDGESLYYLKYRNGKNGYPEIVDHVEGKVEVVPRAMSYRFRVIITNLANPRSARSATAALRGFRGSVFVPRNGEPPRTGFPATHHLNLTSPSGRRIVTDGEGLETGALQSPPFVTFGPPLDVDPTGRYTFDPVFVLVDGTEYRMGYKDAVYIGRGAPQCRHRHRSLPRREPVHDRDRRSDHPARPHRRREWQFDGRRGALGGRRGGDHLGRTQLIDRK